MPSNWSTEFNTIIAYIFSRAFTRHRIGEHSQSTIRRSGILSFLSSLRKGEVKEASEVGVFKNPVYSHGGLDIGDGVLSTNTILSVIIQIHLLRCGEVVSSAQPATGETVIVMSVIHMEMVHVQSDVLLFLPSLVPIQAVLEAASSK